MSELWLILSQPLNTAVGKYIFGHGCWIQPWGNIYSVTAVEYSYLTVEYDSEEKSCICHGRGIQECKWTKFNQNWMDKNEIFVILDFKHEYRFKITIDSRYMSLYEFTHGDIL